MDGVLGGIGGSGHHAMEALELGIGASPELLRAGSDG